MNQQTSQPMENRRNVAVAASAKDPIARTRLPTIPPDRRSRTAHGMTRAAAEGRFELQVCDACGTVQYPPHEICGACLCGTLHWQPVADGGVLLAVTTLQHSNDLYFRERLPWRVGTVRMDAGPSVIVHVDEACQVDDRVRLLMQLDRSGQAVLHAVPAGAGEQQTSGQPAPPPSAQGQALREGRCDPADCRVLITAGRSALGMALTRQLLKAGVRTIFLGDDAPWKHDATFDALCASDPRIERVALDLTDTDSVDRLAASLGGSVDLLLNTPDCLRQGSLLAGRDILQAREALDIHALGLVRLAQAFGPTLAFRGGDQPVRAAAWVNLFSVYALAALPSQAAWSAAQAAALSISQSLRAEMQPGGIRVMHVFSGPIDTEWEQLTPPPKVSVSALASAIIKGLQVGLEDVYVGEVAEELRERLRENHKAVERELGAF